MTKKKKKKKKKKKRRRRRKRELVYRLANQHCILGRLDAGVLQ
jgi:hypothetical protein